MLGYTTSPKTQKVAQASFISLKRYAIKKFIGWLKDEFNFPEEKNIPIDNSKDEAVLVASSSDTYDSDNNKGTGPVNSNISENKSVQPKDTDNNGLKLFRWMYKDGNISNIAWYNNELYGIQYKYIIGGTLGLILFSTGIYYGWEYMTAFTIYSWGQLTYLFTS